MSCCADPRAQVVAEKFRLPPETAAEVEARGDGYALTLFVPEIHCAACIGRIEDAVSKARAGIAARVNFTRRTVTLTWRSGDADPARAIATLRNLGYVPRPLPKSPRDAADPVGRELTRSLAVAGFAAMNVMLLSVAVWAGADGTTARFMNWFAALIALPALAYAARPFFRSALGALAGRRLNMDVPIALAIVLAAALSLSHTLSGAGETYFDAAITLTFFLLAGRLADHITRERARASVRELAALAPATAHALTETGTRPIATDAIVPGMRLHIAAGERLPVDAILLDPASFDLSLATGESRPMRTGAGETVLAGALALTGPIRVEALRPAADSFLATLAGLQRAAEEARSRPARIADRAARIYAPAVHLIALLTFAGWLAAGAGTGAALTTAIAVLIITCPCALGLAVPAVHVAACDRLFRHGLLLKDGAVLERMRRIDEAVFDKTGTLTTPELTPNAALADDDLAAAAALARHSTHPVARAVVRAATRRGLALPRVTEIVEQRGHGITGTLAGLPVYLGASPSAEGLSFRRGTAAPTLLPVTERLRDGAAALVDRLRADGIPVAILSGDRAEAVAPVAARLGITTWQAGCSAADKTAYLDARRAAGAHVLMVGDGLNDGPALAAAYASIAPADASDLSRTAADIVMSGDGLAAAHSALVTARTAHRLILQNFGIAALYNAVAIPLAVLGYASPLLAALAMSTSSILVTLNALRVAGGPRTVEGAPASETAVLQSAAQA